MGKTGRSIMPLTLLAIFILIVLSVFGAFCGAEKAKLFFNSMPLGIYWCFLVILVLAGFARFKNLLRKPQLFIIHIGCILVLIGSLWASQAGHRLNKKLFGIDKIPNGYMLINEGSSEKYVTADDFRQQLGELPFSIKLNDFRLEYYETDGNFAPGLDIRTQDGQIFHIEAAPDKEVSLGEGKSKIKIIKTFKNFKIRLENNQKIITDDQQQGENPAVEINIMQPDGNSYTRYVFENFPDFGCDKNGLQIIYTSKVPKIIRDYLSDVVIIKDGKEVLSKTIEVNHPLHYGGYHFYQYSYDSQMQKYTILLVTSDSGLYLVYGGFWLLGLGLLWQFWFRHIGGYIKSKRKTNEALI